MSDERKKAQAAILERRAKLIALALATSGMGTSCGGKAEGENTNGADHGPMQCLQACLSACLGACLDYPCLTQVCLSYECGDGDVDEDACNPPGTGGALVCLGQPYSGGMGGMGGEGLGGATAGEDPEPPPSGNPPCLVPIR